jgi:tRNA U34 2-thiouridine synthase MnmA/TrmU
MKVLVGISGGPRSMVTAWLLKKQGMQVRGVHLDLFSNERNREGVLEIEKKLGIQIQVIDSAKHALEMFLQESAFSRMSGYPFSAKRVFQRKILFPELFKVARGTGSEKIATGHVVGLQDDPAAGLVRVTKAADGGIGPLLEVLGLDQEMIQRWIAPIGAIPKALLEKLMGEVSPNSLTSNFELDWKELEARVDSSDPSILARDIQIFTTSGVLLGRSPLGALKAGQGYHDPEDPSKIYRVIELQPRSDRAIVQESKDIAISEFHFDEGHWFSGPDLGMGFMDVGMISESTNTPRPIRLIQFEGGRMKGFVEEPHRGENANILKGDSVIFINGTEVLGGARVMKAR